MRIGMGLHITQQRRLPYPTVAVLPDDAVGALGDGVYFSGQVYRKRWVGNREGIGDGILFPINLFPSVGDFDFNCMVRLDNMQNGRLYLVGVVPNSTCAEMNLDSGLTSHNLALRASGGSPQYNAVSTGTDTAWHKLGARRVGNVLTTLVDGVVTATVADTSGWTPLLSTTTTILSSPNTASLSIKACNFRLSAPGGTITARLDEGAGTVINNSTGANGTLTDASPANFWYQSWVPE